MLGDLTAHPPSAPSLSAATPNNNNNSTLRDLPAGSAGSAAGAAAAAQAAQRNTSVPRLKRLNNAQNHNVYTQYQTAEGQVRFRCTECSRSFNLKCTLLRHVRHQHQGRFVPHPCRICGQVFKRTDHLKVHMKKIHRITSATRPNRNATGTEPEPEEQQILNNSNLPAGINNSSLGAGANNISSLSVPLPLPLPPSLHQTPPRNLQTFNISASEPPNFRTSEPSQQNPTLPGIHCVGVPG